MRGALEGILAVRVRVRALLSSEARDGIVHEGRVRLLGVTLEPTDVATIWAEPRAGRDTMATTPTGTESSGVEGGDWVRATRLGTRWTLLRSHGRNLRATLRRAWAWDGVMPWI